MTCTSFAAKAKHRVIIQEQTQVDDRAGGRVVVWSDLWSCRAIVEPQSGREVFQHGQLQSRVGFKITIRFNNSLVDTKTTGSYRVKLDGRYLSITNIRNLNRDMKSYGRVYQEITAVENDAEVAT